MIPLETSSAVNTAQTFKIKLAILHKEKQLLLATFKITLPMIKYLLLRNSYIVVIVKNPLKTTSLVKQHRISTFLTKTYFASFVAIAVLRQIYHHPIVCRINNPSS